MNKKGFTLLEISIVLVIIGLITGGILAGRSLLEAASIRAQIDQVQKYNLAARTFQMKYGSLPGDIPEPDASAFGFKPRGTAPGEGDGNGIIQSNFLSNPAGAHGYSQQGGETVGFWEDLSTARLINGTFNTAPLASEMHIQVDHESTPAIKDFFPEAKIGRGNFMYVWSGGIGLGNNNQPASSYNSVNYFGLSAPWHINCCWLMSEPALTVSEAYSIDSKTDDGLPQTGRVVAIYLTNGNGVSGVGGSAGGIVYAAGGGRHGWGVTAYPNPGEYGNDSLTPTNPSQNTCFDNGGINGATQHYSISVSNGNNVNCALSFQFQ